MTKKEDKKESNSEGLHGSIEVTKFYIVDRKGRGRSKGLPEAFINFIEANPDSTFTEISKALIKRRTPALVAGYKALNEVRRVKAKAGVKTTPYKNFGEYIRERLKGNLKYYTDIKEADIYFGGVLPYTEGKRGSLSTYRLTEVKI